MREDTIYAPASAIGGAIAVLRISGPRAGETVRILSADLTKKPREMRFVRILDGAETVDDSMAVFFPAPHSYTGEDMVEIDCHGGGQTVQRILALLSGLGFRPAEGGEFTRRAFLNGKMDLSQAEAVMDVITASAEQSLKAAMQQLHGSVSREVASIESLLLDALSGIDAAVDYPEEAEEDAYAALPEQLSHACGRIDRLLADGRRGRVLRDGMQVVILGRPNVGKSSLLNALLGQERAIVTSAAGTTRDVLDERTSIRGVPVRLLDTAGIRDAADEVERIGVTRAWKALETADIVLVLVDSSAPLTPEDMTLLQETANMTRIIVKNKSDLPSRCQLPEGMEAAAIAVSAKEGTGLDLLSDRILALAGPSRADAAGITNERHLHALEQARIAVASAMAAEELDCSATDIRSALHFLGEITGTDVDDAVIDRIFSRFCVGK